MPEIERVNYSCRDCRRFFGDPERAVSFANWISAVRGHVITFHRALKLNENVNDFLTPEYVIVPAVPAPAAQVVS